MICPSIHQPVGIFKNYTDDNISSPCNLLSITNLLNALQRGNIWRWSLISSRQNLVFSHRAALFFPLSTDWQYTKALSKTQIKFAHFQAMIQCIIIYSSQKGTDLFGQTCTINFLVWATYYSPLTVTGFISKNLVYTKCSFMGVCLGWVFLRKVLSNGSKKVFLST